MHIRKLLTGLIPLAKKFAARYRRFVTPKRLLVAGGGIFLFLSLVYSVSFYWPRTISFSFVGNNCITSPALLPALTPKEASSSFDVKPARIITIANYPVYSHEACVEPTHPPQENHREAVALKMPGNTFLKKNISVSTGQHPVLSQETLPEKPVPTKDPLILNLNAADRYFSYEVEANGRKAVCAKRGRSLHCDIPRLELAQGQQYDVTIHRLFDDKPVNAILKRKLATVEPVQITGTSITGGQTIYHMPTELSVTLNKPAGTASDVSLYTMAGDTRHDVPITTELSSNILLVRFSQPLPRSAALTLSIGQIGAHDGGYLAAPFSLPFTTSGGPKVAGVNIGSAKVQPGANIVLTFDTGLEAGQDISKFIRIETGSGAAAATLSVQGRRVTIHPASLPACTAFTVKVLDGLKNEHGVSGGSAWQFKSRILCQTVFSIGSSVQGRGITGYHFGSGPNKIIFVGGTHGDERSSVSILHSWVDQLESNPDRIPAHQTIIVIPNLNPDGYAANRRTNANNVDLNRNFPSNNWKSGVSMPNGEFLPNGGGTQPLSEPESSALASYVSGQGPRLVLTYHAAGSVVIPNGSGDSNAIAVEYGRKSTVGYASSGAGMFHYDTTGSFEDWLHDKRGMPALLIELRSRTSFDYPGHRDALWYIAQL